MSSSLPLCARPAHQAIDAATVDQISNALAALEPSRTAYKSVKGAKPGAAGRSAVMVGFCNDAEVGGAVLLTLRASSMRSHRGEVAFPGGMEDEVDGADPVATALRELEEEVGIGRESVQVLGLSHDAMIPAKMRVTPVVGWLGEVDCTTLGEFFLAIFLDITAAR